MVSEGVEHKSKKTKIQDGMPNEQKLELETIGKKVLSAAVGSKKMLGVHVSAAGQPITAFQCRLIVCTLIVAINDA